jgi:hypothetical protein
MPRWDFTCPKCGATKELTFRTVEDADAVQMLCDRVACRTVVVRQVAAPSFKVNGFNAKNHYGVTP